MSKHWFNQPEYGSLLAIKLLLRITAVLGRSATRLLLYPICLYFMLRAPSATRASRQYLARVLGRRPRWREIFRHYFTFASVLFDRAIFQSGRTDQLAISCTNLELMSDLSAQHRGALLLSAHFGSIDIIGKIDAMQPHARISMLMYEGNARMIQALFDSLGGRRRIQVIPIGRVDTLIRAKEQLDVGGWVGVLGDRLMPGDRQIRVPFLGETAAFPAGPFLAASALKVPVVLFVGAYLGGNRYQEHFELLAEEVSIGRHTQEADLEHWVRRYAERLEHYCRTYPYNWFNFYDFWEPARAPLPATRPRRLARSAA